MRQREPISGLDAASWLPVVTTGLSPFQNVIGIPSPFAVARIVAHMYYFSLDFFPFSRSYNSMGEIPPRYFATTKEAGYKQDN